MRTVIFTVIILAASVPLLFADAVILDSGRLVEGQITDDSGDSITLVGEDGKVEKFPLVKVRHQMTGSAYREKKYFYMKDFSVAAGYIIAEDKDTYTIRPVRDEITEVVVKKENINFISVRRISMDSADIETGYGALYSTYYIAVSFSNVGTYPRYPLVVPLLSGRIFGNDVVSGASITFSTSYGQPLYLALTAMQFIAPTDDSGSSGNFIFPETFGGVFNTFFFDGGYSFVFYRCAVILHGGVGFSKMFRYREDSTGVFNETTRWAPLGRAGILVPIRVYRHICFQLLAEYIGGFDYNHKFTGNYHLGYGIAW